MRLTHFIAAAVVCLLNAATPVFSQHITTLQCEHLVNPIGIDSLHPRLSWAMDDAAKGAAQTAYRIIVGTDSAAVSHQAGNTWDSKKLAGNLGMARMGAGKIAPFTKYYWSVQVWNQQGKPLPASPVASFETGMMDTHNWRGSWISDGDDINKKPAPYFRKVFTAGKTIKSARAYVAAAGLYELYLNGNKIGNHRLDPMYTRFDRRTLYVSYDITANLQPGNNAVGVLLGNGWYNHQSIAVWNFDRAPWRARPAFCMDIRITYTDGSTATIVTDDSWKTHTGPIVFNSIYTGEHYDAHKEIPGWNTVNFTDTGWNEISLPGSAGTKNQQPVNGAHPQRYKIPARTMTSFSDTNYVFDMGQNIAGVTQIMLNGAEGTVVRIKHGERLYKTGHVDLSNIDVLLPPQRQHRSLWHRHRDPEWQGAIAIYAPLQLQGVSVCRSHQQQAHNVGKGRCYRLVYAQRCGGGGSLECSNPLINKLWWATNNSYLNNLMGVSHRLPATGKKRLDGRWTFCGRNRPLQF